MIPFAITDRDIQRAELHLLIHGGPRSHHDNLIGALGEIAVYNWINQWSPCYFSDKHSHYDILLGDARTVEVKTMKTSTIPQPHYMVNVAMCQWESKLKSDLWIFVHLDKTLSSGVIVAYCGADKRDRFRSHFAGELMTNGYEYRQDVMDCQISELDDPARLVIHA